MRGRTAEDWKLLELLDPVAEASGFEIVRLRLMGGDRVRRLQIMAEGSDGNLPVADCAKLSRVLSQVLDSADPISGAYILEVSSPGVDRPLTRPKDFGVFTGLEARVEIDRLSDGRKRFKGEIAGFEDEAVILRPEGEEAAVRLPFAWIVDAKLVLNQALLARGAAERMARVTASDTSEFSTRNPMK